MTGDGSTGAGERLGWPFLVAAGRRRDHSVLVAPDFLVGSGEHGVLLDQVQPGSEDDPARVVTVTTHRGLLTVAYRTHLLAPQDLVEAGSDVPKPPPSARDEHNRPLRLAFGFVTPHNLSAGPADGRLDADLDACQQPALAAYRAFVEDESSFQVAASSPLPLSCSPQHQQRVDERPAPPPSLGPAAPAVRTGITLGVLVVVLAALLALFLVMRHDSAPTPCPTAPGAEGRPATASQPSTCPPYP